MTPGGLKSTALAGIESLINAALSYDPATLERIGQLSDKVLKIECTFPPLSFCVFHADDGLTLMQCYEGEADTVLRGNAVSLATLAINENRTTFAGSGVEVTGNQELLGDMQVILKDLDIDWETALAQLIGDVPAYIVGNSLRATTRFGNTAKDHAASIVTEYAKNDSEILPTAEEVDAFSAEVRLLRADTDRLEARLNASLEQHLKQGPQGVGQ